MEYVIAERTFDSPVSVEFYQSVRDTNSNCLDINGVTFVASFLSVDGQRSICVYRAPDAEAVRRMNRQARLPDGQSPLPVDIVWTGTRHAPPEAAPVDAGSRRPVLVERSFADRPIFKEVQAVEDAKAWCLDQYRVVFLETFYSLDRRKMICVYAAPDAEAVRSVQNTTGLPYERVWPASVIF